MRLTTTLNKIRKHRPCGMTPDVDGSKTGWLKLLRGLPEGIRHDDEIDFADILKINGGEATIWCFRAAPEHHKVWTRFAIFCAWQARDLMRDERSKNALVSAWKFLSGELAEADLACAAADAYAVYVDIDIATDADASYAAHAAYVTATVTPASAPYVAWASCAASAFAAYVYASKNHARVLALVLQDPENHEKILLDNMQGFEEELLK